MEKKDIQKWNMQNDSGVDPEFVGGGMTPQQIANHNQISVDARIWLLLHVHDELFTEPDLHLIACDFAEQT